MSVSKKLNNLNYFLSDLRMMNICILVYWCIGVLVYWCISILVYWYIGILVQTWSSVVLFQLFFINQHLYYLTFCNNF